MANAFVELARRPPDAGIVVGTHCPIALVPPLQWIESSHPVPDARSERAGRAALDLARQGGEDNLLVVLISGGASALVVQTRDGLTLGDKQATTRQLLLGGADIDALNTVRKHLSAIKGGQLAAEAASPVLALCVSDVVGDDPSRDRVRAHGAGPDELC